MGIEHYNYVVRKQLKENSADWGKLLADVPWAPEMQRPLARDPAEEALQLLSKYNWQFRRPSRWSEAVGWESHIVVSDKAGDYCWFFDEEWLIPPGNMRPSPVWNNQLVDWQKWQRRPSGIVLPLMSAVGDRMFLIRRVYGISFAGMVFLLGGDYTMTELEEAWLEMPLIKVGQLRGRRGGTKRRRLYS